MKFDSAFMEKFGNFYGLDFKENEKDLFIIKGRILEACLEKINSLILELEKHKDSLSGKKYTDAMNAFGELMEAIRQVESYIQEYQNPDVYRQLAYYMYLTKHKYHVGMQLIKKGVYIQAFTHDLSKYDLFEFVPYANCFYDDNGDSRAELVEDSLFQYAWLHHLHSNPHHWQHWLLKEDSGTTLTLDMPSVFVKEMFCDWLGVHRALGRPPENLLEWYATNKGTMVLSDRARQEIESFLEEYKQNLEPKKEVQSDVR